MIVTTNLAFKEWDSVFKDPHLTGALVDRLARRAHVLDMSGKSYRFKETRSWLVQRGKLNHDPVMEGA